MVFDLVQGAALMLALCWILSFSGPQWRGLLKVRPVASGILFGSICVLGMLKPVVLAPGVLLDTRSAVIGLATLFGGPVVGVITMVMAGAVRWWLGGAGKVIGVVGVFLPLLFGLMFRAAVEKGLLKLRAREFLVFGLVINGLAFAIYLSSYPQGVWPPLEVVFLFLVGLPVATVLLGLLLSDMQVRTSTIGALQQSKSRLRAIVAAVPDMVLVMDEDGRYLDVVAPPRLQMLHYFSDSQDWVGRPTSEVMSPEHTLLFISLVKRTLRSKLPQSLEYTVQGIDGQRTLEVRAMRMDHLCEGKQAVVLLARDITQRRIAEEQVRTLTLYDALTNLPNRSFLLARMPLARRESARTKRFCALLSIDLDDFGSINDTHGNLAGDRMLQRVAQCMVPLLPPGATLVRWGADEFALLLESLPLDEERAGANAARIAQKIVDAIALTATDDILSHKSSACVGIALFRDVNESDNPIRRATLALYTAKGAGTGQIRIYDQLIQDAITARLAMEAGIREGLQQGEFVIHYQPQLNNAGTITGVEALVRWQHPERGLLYPGDFLAAAESGGLMDALDTQVLSGACAQLARWSQDPAMRDLVISVNISAFQMGHAQFATEVMAHIAKSGADPHRLKLELTETALINDMTIATRHMVALRAQGVSFALDDFGTGYSSMSYLQRLPLDQIKIDQSFVKGLPSEGGSLAIIRAIVALATNFGFEVLAEGVESQAQRDMLEAEGCLLYQGYLFSRAVTVADLETLIRDRGTTGSSMRKQA